MLVFGIARLALHKALQYVTRIIPYFAFIHQKQTPSANISFGMWFKQKVIGRNQAAYWPTHHTSTIISPQNIYVGKGSFPGYMPGCYIQGIGKIYIGDYSIFAANVGIISANHSLHDFSKHIESTVRIGSYCWVGFSSIILPNVQLGDFTIIGAGSVVTKSFPEGRCIIAGNPAKLIRYLHENECIAFSMDNCDYHGYIKEVDFNKYKKKYLHI